MKLINIYKRIIVSETETTLNQKEVWRQHGDIGSSTTSKHYLSVDLIYLDYLGQKLSDTMTSPVNTSTNFKLIHQVKESLEILEENGFIKKDLLMMLE